MANSEHPRREVSPFLTLLVSGISYFVCARLSLFFIIAPEGISAFWPPTALLLGALLTLQNSKWPWVCAGVLPANLLANMLVGETWGVAFAFAMTDTLVPLA